MARTLAQASRVIVTRTGTSKPLPPTDELVFGKAVMKHLRCIHSIRCPAQHQSHDGSYIPPQGRWSAPEIQAIQSTRSGSSMLLVSILYLRFRGNKGNSCSDLLPPTVCDPLFQAYPEPDGKPHPFGPRKNMERMSLSAARVTLLVSLHDRFQPPCNHNDVVWWLGLQC